MRYIKNFIRTNADRFDTIKSSWNLFWKTALISGIAMGVVLLMIEVVVWAIGLLIEWCSKAAIPSEIIVAVLSIIVAAIAGGTLSVIRYKRQSKEIEGEK